MIMPKKKKVKKTLIQGLPEADDKHGPEVAIIRRSITIMPERESEYIYIVS